MFILQKKWNLAVMAAENTSDRIENEQAMFFEPVVETDKYSVAEYGQYLRAGSRD